MMDINAKASVLVERLAKMASAKAQSLYSSALYAGTNDVKTDYKMDGKLSAVVTAEGEAVTFIEYGTGMYPEPPADMNEQGYTHGTYGKGHGANPPWYYYGEQGNTPDTMVVRDDPSKGTVVRTFGNPANLCLHLAKQHVEEQLVNVAKEVFNG